MALDTWICMSSLLFIWIMSIPSANCYEQLINTKTTNVSSSSVHRYFNGRGTADLTIDGNFNQYINYCMHTALDWSEAWLIIDLGDIYNVKSVKIWYRDDTGSDRAYRLRGFSILASQNPEFNENDTCYQDPGHVAPETVLEVDCVRTARYIKIFTNEITFAYQYGAVLEICEIRIFGCPRWKYGERCESCGNCKMDCHATGQCDQYGCIHDGYHLPYCKECRSGRYGKDCNSLCGHCANNATCNNITGSCPNKECAPGWKYTTDWKCDKECQKGFYGRNCGLQCGYCVNKTTCDHVTGFCPSGFCDPGWIHSSDRRCNQACEEGTYGKHCISTCGHCANKATCHPVNGSCPDGNCAPGWKRSKDRKCNEACDHGWYGRECKQRCGYCRGNKPCHHVTGSCSGLCKPEYSGDKCVFSEHLANQREMIRLMRELLANKRRKIDLRCNETSPTDF